MMVEVTIFIATSCDPCDGNCPRTFTLAVSRPPSYIDRSNYANSILTYSDGMTHHERRVDIPIIYISTTSTNHLKLRIR